MSEKTYTLDEIRAAFWKVFHESGQRDFSIYDDGADTKVAWLEFTKALDVQPEPPDPSDAAPTEIAITWCAVCNRPVAQTHIEGKTDQGMPVGRLVTMSCHGATWRSALGVYDPLPDVAFAPLADADAGRAFLARARDMFCQGDTFAATDYDGNVVQFRHLSQQEMGRWLVGMEKR